MRWQIIPTADGGCDAGATEEKGDGQNRKQDRRKRMDVNCSENKDHKKKEAKHQVWNLKENLSVRIQFLPELSKQGNESNI